MKSCCRSGGKAKTLKIAKDALAAGKSVVVDNTHRSVRVTPAINKNFYRYRYFSCNIITGYLSGTNP